MQIAKLFAGLGFQVDTSGLVKFKKAIADARSEMTNISRGAKTATGRLSGLRSEVNKLSTSMRKLKTGGSGRATSDAYRNLAGDVHKVNNAFNQISANQPRTTKAIGKINASVIAGLTHWNAYRRSIVQTRQSLANLNGDLNRLRANSRVDVRIRNTGGNGGGGSGGGSGGLGGAGALGGAFGLRAMLGSFLPALAVSSAGGALGFGAARGVEAARDQTRMESMILMTSKSGEEFARTLDYVKGEAARLGLSSTELGKSFAQINMAARGLDQGTKEKMFTGFSEFMMSMGTSADDQKGIFRAFNQMFSNNRILQEEINQLSERGIPATLVYDAAMKAYDTTNIQKIKKLQEDGKLDPKKVLPIMAQMVQDLAHDSGSYAKMMESSIVKQGKLYEQLRQTSKTIMDGGLDVYLGKIFGQLTEIVKELQKIAQGMKFIVDNVNKLKKGIDSVSNGFGGEILSVLLLLVFRFKVLSKAVGRWTFAVRNGAVASVALAGFLKDVLGKTIFNLIKRFGGWITVIYAAATALKYLGEQVQQRDLGNWTIFDTISIASEAAVAKVKLLIAELKWLKVYMTSGAMIDGRFEEVLSIFKGKSKGVLSNLNDQSLTNDFTKSWQYSSGYEYGEKLKKFLFGSENINIPTSSTMLNNNPYSNKPMEFVFTLKNDNGQTLDTIRTQVPTMAQ